MPTILSKLDLLPIYCLEKAKLQEIKAGNCPLNILVTKGRGGGQPARLQL